MMNERSEQTNKYVGEDVEGSSSFGLTARSMQNIKVVLLNKPGLSALPTDAALVTLKRNLDNRGELILHSKDEGQHPIFTRSDIEVNLENKLEERIDLNHENTLKGGNSRTAGGKGRLLKTFTKSGSIEISPSGHNEDLHYVRKVYQSKCTISSHDSVDKGLTHSKTSAVKQTAERSQHSEKRSSNSKYQKNKYEDRKNKSLMQCDKHLEKRNSLKMLINKQGCAKKENSPRRSHTINRCTEKCCAASRSGRRSWSSNVQKSNRSPTIYFGKHRHSVYPTRSSPRKVRRKRSYSSSEKDRDYMKQSRDGYSSKRCGSSYTRKHSRSYVGVASTHAENCSDLYSRSRGLSSSSRTIKHSQYETEKVSFQTIQDYMYALPSDFGYYGAEEFWIPTPSSSYFISIPYMSVPSSFCSFEPTYYEHYPRRPRSRSEPTVRAASSPTNQLSNSDWEEPSSTT